MSEIYLYKIREGKIISTPVIKETPKMYWINDTTFSYSRNIYKDEACTTPEEAFDSEYLMALKEVELGTKKINHGSKRLYDVVKLMQLFDSK